jgi:cytochrome c oxidase subunit 3
VTGAPTSHLVPVDHSMAARPGHATSGGVARFGMIVFLASDVMLFASFFSAYYLLRSTNPAWPPESVELDRWRALVATLVLVASSLTMVVADRALAEGSGRRARRWVLVSVALGVAFAVNQFLEYGELSFGIDDHPYGSAYWMLTGVHTAHVVAGIGALLMLFVRLARSRDLPSVEPFASGVSIYWHMVDVVWVAVFLTIWVVR